MIERFLATALFFSSILLPFELLAAPENPLIQLEMDGPLLSDGEKQHLEQQLATAVEARGFVLIATSGPLPSDPIAKIVIKGSDGPKVAVQIEIADKVTTKTVLRTIDLNTVPRDGWILTIALSADELLRASWAELLIEDAPEPEVEVPAAVTQAVEETTTESRGEPRLLLEVGASGLMLSSSWMGLGLEAGIGVRVSPRVFLLGRFGWRRSPWVEAEFASLRSDLVTGGISTRVELTRPEGRFGLGTVFGLTVGGLGYEIDPVPGYAGRNITKAVVLAHGGLVIWTELSGFLQPFLEAGLSIPVLGTRAIDGDEVITDFGGVGGKAVVGVNFLFGR